MITIRSPFLFYAGILAIFLSAAALAADGGDYKLSTGDVLSISVFDEPDLSLDEVRIAATGVISFPLLGEIKVVGLTAIQVERQLKEMLLDGYLKHPKITVSIKEYRLFYVHGEVKSPGGYNYQNGLTIRKAIVLAGGFTERASKEKITLVTEEEVAASRGTEGGKSSWGDEAVRVGLNHPVRPGDVVTVGESFF
ncbi:MAG: polysaccharide export protein [Candidatus Polarisedimenticolaceae bacterium]|nr:polysaccharide export protein [Candidatus Polarisedimenticolaceae bacterium]